MSAHKLFFLILTIAIVGSTLAAVVPPATANNNGRIVGGQETSIAKYPYQVSVRLDTYILLHICGGSIYSSKVILTAAHCIKGRFASYIRIVAGKSTIVDDDEGIRVSKLIYHSGYNKNTKENDVGLIILAENLIYSDVVQPIPLAKAYPTTGIHGTVTGWGKKDEESETLTNLLQEVDVQIVDRIACGAKYITKDYTITEQMVCAGVDAGGKDACQGDSGGPLAVNGQLSGIVSWGIGCARIDFPGVYASVPFHIEWIQDSAKPYL